MLEYCINNHYVQEVCIDFENCILDNSPIIVGNENEVNRSLFVNPMVFLSALLVNGAN